jgi:hypothetical protein
MSLICNRFLILRLASTCISPQARLSAFPASPTAPPPPSRLLSPHCRSSACLFVVNFSPTHHTATAHPLSLHCRRFFHFFRFFRFFRRPCFFALYCLHLTAFASLLTPNPTLSYTFLRFPTPPKPAPHQTFLHFPTLPTLLLFFFHSRLSLHSYTYRLPPSPHQVRTKSAPRLHQVRFDSAPSTHVNPASYTSNTQKSPTPTPPNPVHSSPLRSKHEAKEERRSSIEIR